jgi:hypothetical protein
MNMQISRRAVLAAATAAIGTLKAEPSPLIPAIVKHHDESVEYYLKAQITDPSDRWRGSLKDEYGLPSWGAAGGMATSFATAFLHPDSKFHYDKTMVQRIALACDFLQRESTPDGNINLAITNWNSTPDTAFCIRSMATGAILLKRNNQQEVFALMDPYLRTAGRALATGGVHTPNHRWVVSAALSQLYEIYADPAYLRRIDQWFAEGMDIDADGQFDERSTGQYAPIVDAALVTVAAKLNRPQLLDYVRRNLDATLYLLHADYELVTEFSHRQDLNERRNAGSYWFPLHYLGMHDANGRYLTLSRQFASTAGSLAALMEYPELNQSGPPSAPLPNDFEKTFPGLGLGRIRRGQTSVSILKDYSRFFTLRHGEAVLNGVRFSSAFFGKGQFTSDEWSKEGGSYKLVQHLEGPYFQPFTPPRAIHAGEWNKTRKDRQQSQICRLEQIATITETKKGFRVRVQSHGTKDVPVAVEINFRPGGKFEGVEPAYKAQEAWILPSGATGVFRAGKDEVRFGPGLKQHAYTAVRGAQPKLDGPSVYLTGFTPFDHSIEFEV